uniref:Uncharacterized protein n=1 Tax=Acrobeloides nanus TaxID=290746 RepID=A0A914CUJ0_9BILA
MFIRNILLVFLVLKITSANYSAGPFAKWTVQNAWKHPECATEIQKVLSPDLEEEECDTKKFYAAVIDGGSTGTRLHLFKFKHNPEIEHSMFELKKETFKELKPGLSSFCDNPEMAAENIRHLIMLAKKAVPKELWKHTPVTVKATAGLRLLPDDKAETILYHVQDEVDESGLLVGEESVGMLSEIDEGVFAWFTVNYLTNQLRHVALNANKATIAALDLGGGSTQVTFAPQYPVEAFSMVGESEFSHTINIFGIPVKLYTHSYLGNGLIAARLGIAQLTTQGNDSNTRKLTTHCLPADFLLDDWDYSGHIWIVTGTQNSSFEDCLASAKEYVVDIKNVREVPELQVHDVYVFSYFYDRGVQANIIRNSHEQKGGWATVGDYKLAAERACSLPAEAIGPEHWQPWQCLDLTYIYSLLHYGYGMPDDKEIHLTKKINGMETSWALGAAYHMLSHYHTTPHTPAVTNETPADYYEGQNDTTQPGIITQMVTYISDRATDVLSIFKMVS